MQDKLKSFEEQVKKNNAQFIKILKLIRQGIKSYENPVTNAHKIKELSKKLKGVIEKVGAIHELPLQLTGLVAELETDAERLKDELKFEFGSELEKELKTRGFELRGQLPTLYANYYTIKVDFQTGKAIILFGPETIRPGVALKPQILANVIQEIDKELKKEPMPPAQLLAQLYEAWKKIGEAKAPIIRVLKELVFLIQPEKFFINPARSNFIEYTRTKFGYDLYRLETLQIREVNGQRLSLITATFDATSHKRDYIWVPINERGDGINYAYLTFK